MTIKHAAEVIGAEANLIGRRRVGQARRGVEGLGIGGLGSEEVAGDYGGPASCEVHFGAARSRVRVSARESKLIM